MSRFRKNILLPIVAFVTSFTTGCYEPSDFNAFGDGERVVVIEGRVTDADSVSTVVVTRTVDALNDSDCEFVNDAIVYLRDDQGNSAQLQSAGNGVYRTAEIDGTVGTRYLLTVEVDGDHYSSIDKMPPQVLIDSMVVEYRDNYTIFDTIGYYVSIYTRRNNDSVQFYRVEIEKNGTMLNDGLSLWLYQDSHLSDIYKMTIPHTFFIGDSVVVGVYSLSANTYEYFSGLSKQFSTIYSNIQPPLTNPKTNILPSALGCFQASSVIRTRFVIGNARRKVVMVAAD